MGPADERYGTIGAAPVTTLGNLQIGIRMFFLNMPGRERNSRSAESFHNRKKIPRAEPAVHLRNLFPKGSHVSLGKAAEDKYFPDIPGHLPLDSLQNGPDGLFLGISDEAAGVENHDIRLPVPFFRQNGITVPQLRKKVFGIDLVL